jgi:hypothetical protein
MRRRILFTGGSGVLSTSAPGVAGGVLAVAGRAGFAGADTPAGVPAATVSPGVGVRGVVVLFADGSWSTEVSNMQTLRERNSTDTLQRRSGVQIIQLPAVQG